MRRTLSGEAEVRFDERERWLRVRRAGGEILCNFAAAPVQLPIEESHHVVLATHAESYAADDRTEVLLPPLAGALVR